MTNTIGIAHLTVTCPAPSWPARGPSERTKALSKWRGAGFDLCQQEGCDRSNLSSE